MTLATLSACDLTGPTFASPVTWGDVEEPADPAGGRGVEHDGVIGEAAREPPAWAGASVAFP